jgi:hypothetical protein
LLTPAPACYYVDSRSPPQGSSGGREGFWLSARAARAGSCSCQGLTEAVDDLGLPIVLAEEDLGSLLAAVGLCFGNEAPVASEGVDALVQLALQGVLS